MEKKIMTLQIGFIVLLGFFLTMCYVVYESNKEINKLKINAEYYDKKITDYNVLLANQNGKHQQTLELVENLLVNNRELKARIEKLEEELQKKKEVANNQDIELELFARAIFRLETGNGTSSLWKIHNNPGGIKCGSEYCSYSSKEEGMNSLKQLLKWYHNKFGTDYKSATDLYCQCGEDYYPLFKKIYEEEKKKMSRGL